MEYILEQFNYMKYKVEICFDEYAENPREAFDNLGTIVYWHKRYNLGDVDGIKGNLQPGDIDNEDIKLPISLLDHSGLHIYVGTHKIDAWDSGFLGYIYVNQEKVKKEFSWKKLSEKRRKKILQILNSEVETYDSYLKGEIYSYVVKDYDDNIIDTCSGFYDLEECKKEAMSITKYYVEKGVNLSVNEDN